MVTEASNNPLDNSAAAYAVWYGETVLTGSAAINLLEKGVTAGNLKGFIAVTAMSAFAGSKVVSCLNEYLDARQAREVSEA